MYFKHDAEGRYVQAVGDYTMRQTDKYRFFIDCSNDPELIGEERIIYRFEHLLPGVADDIEIYTNASRYCMEEGIVYNIRTFELLDGKVTLFDPDTRRVPRFNIVNYILNAYFENVQECGKFYEFKYDEDIQSGKYIPYYAYSTSPNSKLYIYLDFPTVISLDYNSLSISEKQRIEKGIHYTMPFYNSIPAKYYKKKLNELEIMDAYRRYMSNLGDYFLIKDKEKHISHNLLLYEIKKNRQLWKQ